MNTKVVKAIVATLLAIGLLVGAGAVGFRIGVTQSPQIAEQMAQWRQAMRPPAAQGAPDGAVVPPQGPMGRGQMGAWGSYGPRGGMGHGSGYAYGPGYNYGRGGFGIIGGIFRLFFTLLLIGLIIGIVRRFAWGRRMGWGRWYGHHGGPNGDDVPPHFAEWYRRMKAKDEAKTNADSTPNTPAE